MNKQLKKVIAITAIATTVFLCACSGGKSSSLFKEAYDASKNLAADTVVYNENMEKINSFKLTSKNKYNNHVTVDLKETKAFNTITLAEAGKSVTLFSIYASNTADKDYKLIYQGDTIENGRTCFVGDVSYRFLRVFVTDASEKFTVNQIGVYNTSSDKAENLRVNAYIVADKITETSDFSMLDSVTDLIFFGMANFTKTGDIIFLDGEGNQTDETEYAKKLDILKKAIGERDINIIVDIHVPYGNANADINSMMKENLDHSVNNIKTMIEKYDFAGYDIDYEYPSNNAEWKLFNDYLRAVDKALPNKIISIATSPWALKFDKDVVELIDRVELMLYDGFDSHGYQSAFPYTVSGTETLLGVGFTKDKIDIGVPFYSRPTNGHEFWGNYNEFYEKMGRYDNLVSYNGFDHQNQPMTAPQYFNSYQMIADKTAFAIDSGLGGIMIWHLACDIPYSNDLSLFKAIADTKAAK